MVIQHNIPALNSHRLLGVNNANTAKNLEKLSSGYKINRAGDDAAGLAISEKMRGQIRGLGMAEQNAENAISLIQTAEGGMQEMHAIAQRMREIAVQSTNGTYQDAVDRDNLNQEFQQLKQEFDRIVDYTNYNGIKLLNGTPYASSVSATNTISDLAVGASEMVADFSDPSSPTLGGTDLSGQVIINYDADGKFISAAGTDAAGNAITGSIVNGQLVLTMEDASSNNFTVTIDGDWTQANKISDIGKVTLDFTVKGDDSGVVTIDKVKTEMQQPKVAAAGDETDLLGWDGATFARAGAGNSSGYTGPFSFDIAFKSDGTIDLQQTQDNLHAAMPSGANIANSSVTLDGNNDLVIKVGSAANNYRSFTLTGVDMTAISNVDGLEAVTVNLTIGTGNFADTPAAGGSIAYGATKATPTAGTGTGPLWRGDYTQGNKTPILFQVGANGTRDQQIELMIYDMSATELGIKTEFDGLTNLTNGYILNGTDNRTYNVKNATDAAELSMNALHVEDKDAANISIEVLTTSINDISKKRAELGAIQNRLEYTLNNLGVTKENLTSAESTIRDVDMAKEMTDFTKNNILVQASQAMLAQANALPQGVLNLLR